MTFGSRAGSACSSAVVVAVLFLVAPSAAGQTTPGDLLWTSEFGSVDSDFAYALATDASGVYVAGSTSGVLPGQTSAGHAFVAKFDADGSRIWTRQFGSSSADEALALTADASGVYAAGRTMGALEGQTNVGDWDAFLVKYDADGNHVWTRQFGTSGFDEADGLAVNASGVYVAGSTDGAFPDQTSAGNSDAFVLKYDADGNLIWTRQFGSSGGDVAMALTVNASDVYVAGQVGGILPGQTKTGSLSDAFVLKYDADGVLIWTRQFGSPWSDGAAALAVNASGVYVAGYTDGALPGQTYAGSRDAFVVKYDGDGNSIWTREFGSGDLDAALGLGPDASGVYVAGTTSGALPGQTHAGWRDAFLVRYDSDGRLVWTRQFGTGANDLAFALSEGPLGVYMAGYTNGTFAGQTNAGSTDIFVVRIASTPESPTDLASLLMANLLLIVLAAAAVSVVAFVMLRIRKHRGLRGERDSGERKGRVPPPPD